MATRHMPRITALLLALLFAADAAAVQVQDLVRLKGSEPAKLTGMGLVVGLKGTGDGDKYMPAIRALASLLQKQLDPNVVAAELKGTKNVAIVTVTAEIGGAGVREGDLVDVKISAVGAAKSLEGGRLFFTPLTPPIPGAKVFAIAEGDITIENEDVPTVGRVANGAQLTRNVMAQYMDEFGRLTLVLNNEVATWPMANNLASLINGYMAPDGPNIARAINQKNVVIQVPKYEQQDPAAFISQILQSYVDPSQISTGARVLINEKTGTIVVGAEVQISPVVVTHRGLTITSITPAPEPTPRAPQVRESNWTAVDPEKRGGARLIDLLRALEQLQVSSADRIAIVKEIHAMGKLHAQLIIK